MKALQFLKDNGIIKVALATRLSGFGRNVLEQWVRGHIYRHTNYHDTEPVKPSGSKKGGADYDRLCWSY